MNSWIHDSEKNLTIIEIQQICQTDAHLYLENLMAKHAIS